MTNPADLDIVGAARLISEGELSPLELTEACLQRVEQHESIIKAFTTLDADGALAQARALTEELKSSGPRSPVHGIPVTIKDLVDVAGLPTTASSRVLQGNVAAEDAPVVANLRAAGAVIVGKVNLQEFAYGVVSLPTRNPWSTGRIPGGSSGGSAAAVAAGMCLGSVGTDTAGSVRIPSALCGTTGLSPAPGVVSLDGIIALAPSLDACGPITRTAEDARLLLAAMTGRPPLTPPSADGMRVGVPADLGATTGADGDVVESVTAATEALEKAGLRTVEVELPPFAEWDRPRSFPLMLEALEVHTKAGWYPQREALYSPEIVANFRFAEALDEETLAEGRAQLPELIARFEAAFEHADVLLYPTTPSAAATVEEAATSDDGHRPPIVRALTRLCGPVNVSRRAALSVQCGLVGEGLPVGMQFVGADEASILSAGLAFQEVTDWHTRRAPLVAGAE